MQLICTTAVADILLANGDELNLILPTFARPLNVTFFFHQLFGTYRNIYCWMKIVNDFTFQFATFSLKIITAGSIDAGIDGKI